MGRRNIVERRINEKCNRNKWKGGGKRRGREKE